MLSHLNRTTGYTYKYYNWNWNNQECKNTAGNKNC